MDDDMILPDDFESLPQDDGITEETTETDTLTPDGEDTTPPTEETQTPEPETVQEQRLKLKFNHEEREISLEEATLLAQKGMNYEKAVERARQEARDAWIAEQGHTWNGKSITTEAEYKQALAEQEIMNKYSDLPDELVQEILEGRRDREERAKERAEREQQAKKDAEVSDFLDYFQRVNERPFSAGQDSIPQEVKDAVDRGESLKAAYTEWHNKTLLSQLKIMKQNETNKQKAPIGSVTAFGGNKTEPSDPFLDGFNSF